MLRDFDFIACFPSFCRLLHFTDKLIWFGKSSHFQNNWQKFRQPALTGPYQACNYQALWCKIVPVSQGLVSPWLSENLQSPEPAGTPAALRVRDVPHRGREHPQPGEARGAGDQLSLDRARGCFQCKDAGILTGKLLNSFCACLQAEDSCSIPLSSSQPLEDCLSSKDWKESDIHANCRPTAKKNETTSNLFEKNGRISDQNDQNFWILACQ